MTTKVIVVLRNGKITNTIVNGSTEVFYDTGSGDLKRPACVTEVTNERMEEALRNVPPVLVPPVLPKVKGRWDRETK